MVWLGFVIPLGCGGGGESGAGGAPGSGGQSGLDGGGGSIEGGGWIGTDGSLGGSAGSDGAVADTCKNKKQDGDETDQDCGGSCPPCGLGSGCEQAEDCVSYVCVSGLCCTLSSYDKNTGLVSGTADICCNGSDVRLSVEDCGVGDAHSADPVDPNCAHAAEGAMNGGSCCAKIICQAANCQP